MGHHVAIELSIENDYVQFLKVGYLKIAWKFALNLNFYHYCLGFHAQFEKGGKFEIGR